MQRYISYLYEYGIIVAHKVESKIKEKHINPIWWDKYISVRLKN